MGIERETVVFGIIKRMVSKAKDKDRGAPRTHEDARDAADDARMWEEIRSECLDFLDTLVKCRSAIVEFGAAQQDPKRYDAARCRLLDLARQIK